MKIILEDIERVMNEQGIDISIYDVSFLEKSIKSRMDETAVNDAEDYISLLKNGTSEAETLSKSLSNYYSDFFRNTLTFSVLEHLVFPKIFDQNSGTHKQELRIWSAGCSSGQEAYSLAMLADHLNNNQEVPCFTFGTDKSSSQLEYARKGEYDLQDILNTRLSFVKKYFIKRKNTYTVTDHIKSQVDFSFYDIIESQTSSPSSSIYGDFDLIMCSNLLFYYNPEIQKRIFQKIKRSLKPGGYFVTGEAEKAITNAFSPFTQISPIVPIFIYK